MTQIVRTCSECDLAYFDRFAEGRIDPENQRVLPFDTPTDPFRSVLIDWKLLTEDPNICPLCLADDNLDDLEMYTEAQKKSLQDENLSKMEQAMFVRIEAGKRDYRMAKGWEEELERRKNPPVEEEIDYDAAYREIFRGTTDRQAKRVVAK